MEELNKRIRNSIQMITQVFDEKCKQCPKYELCKHLRQLALQKHKENKHDNN